MNTQGQVHMNTQTSTTSQHTVFNLQTILNDIQSRLIKLNLLDSINDRLWNIEQRFEMVENDISQLKRSVTEHEKYLETNVEIFTLESKILKLPEMNLIIEPKKYMKLY